jgi:hypothetical protein
MTDELEIPWIPAADNPWGVAVLDVRPVTLGMLSSSTDPQMASNAISYGGEDGSSFAGEPPPVERTVDAALTFAIDGALADGVLFAPSAMEDKWAMFVAEGRILFVRSWLRKVWVTADVHTEGDTAVVGPIHGAFLGADSPEAPELTVRLVDFLLRSHALQQVWPAPLPPGLEEDPKAAAMWCMSMFGHKALVATPHAVPRQPPPTPLRTHSRLHIALAKGDLRAAEQELARGLPIDLRAGDGSTTLQWAGSRDDVEAMAWLLDRGCPVDARSAEGSTALMNAVQGRKPGRVRWLLERGADPDARDSRGFTALHRAAEMGEPEIVKLLLERGATAGVEAAGHTPRSLAEARDEQEIMALLAGYER